MSLEEFGLYLVPVLLLLVSGCYLYQHVQESRRRELVHYQIGPPVENLEMALRSRQFALLSQNSQRLNSVEPYVVEQPTEVALNIV